MCRLARIPLLFIAFATPHHYAMADDWTHRVAMLVSNSGALAVDYTVRVSFGSANAEVFDLSLAGGADWRFRKKDGVTTLSRWMEWWSTDPDTAIALVKLDTLKPGADSIYLYFGNPSAISTSSGTIFPLFQDFNTDFTVSGVTDILNMQGLGVDSSRRVAMDTSAAKNQCWRREEGNVLCNPNAPADYRYLHIYSAYCGTYTTDSSWMYLETSSDGFTFTKRGRLDTLGGKASCDSARGEDTYTIIYHDTLWTYYEYKGDFNPPCPTAPKCDRIGLCYSADNGLSWTFKGKVVSDSTAQFTWLLSPSSPAVILWDTSKAGYPNRKHNIYLAVEAKGYFPGYKDCGAGMLALFGAQHPLGVYDTVHCYPCSTAVPTSFYRAAVPDQFFNVDDSLYVDAHAMKGSSAAWKFARFLLSNDLQSLSSVRYFSKDSIPAEAIISQDILRDSSWMAWLPAPSGGTALNTGKNVRYRTMFTNPSAAPYSWSGFKKSSIHGFNEARNGQLLLAAEPFREDNNNSAIGLRSDTGFDSNFVLEYRQKLKWDTLGPLAVVSFGSGNPAPFDGVAFNNYLTATDDGYFLKYGSGTSNSRIGHKRVDSTQSGVSAFTIPDSMMNSWRVNHLAFGPNDTLRFWMDGLAPSTSHKKRDPSFNTNAKRIQFASGEGRSASYPPRAAQMQVDWVLVRPFTYPEPTITFGDVQAIPPQPTVVVQEEDGYLRLHWTNTGAPSYRVLYATTLDGPYSLLLSTGDTTATVARTETAAVKCFYQVLSASE